MKTRVAVAVLAIVLIWVLVAYFEVRETARSFPAPVSGSEIEVSELLKRVDRLEDRLDRHETYEREYVGYVEERFEVLEGELATVMAMVLPMYLEMYGVDAQSGEAVSDLESLVGEGVDGMLVIPEFYQVHRRVDGLAERIELIEGGMDYLDTKLGGAVNWLRDITDTICSSEIVVFEEAGMCNMP